jgi:hypothetical protein
MANELQNATILMGDSDFRDWMRAATVYEARAVIIEAGTVADHATRLKLAQAQALNPDTHLNIFVNAIACDPTVASVGSSVGTAAGTITQDLMLQKVKGIWTPLAQLLYPPVSP